jgi:MYXO-CTERM domain-containing protein
MYLDTFEPAGDEDDVVKELDAVLKKLKSFGVKSLIIDTIDNGGGSVTLGLKLARLLSKKPLNLPQQQLKVSETWIDQFETQSLEAPSPAERSLAKDVADQLKADRAAGKSISSPFPADILLPFQLATGNDALPDGLKVVLMVNEMCASMCDIFASVVQDNHLATVMGTRTMGAGGNVVQHFSAPNSNLILAQTESLVLRTDGTPIENRGVTPDVAFDTNAGALDKMEPAKQKALEILSCAGADCGQPKADGVGQPARARGCAVAPGAADGALPLALLFALSLALVRRRGIVRA